MGVYYIEAGGQTFHVYDSTDPGPVCVPGGEVIGFVDLDGSEDQVVGRARAMALAWLRKEQG